MFAMYVGKAERETFTKVAHDEFVAEGRGTVEEVVGQRWVPFWLQCV